MRCKAAFIFALVGILLPFSVLQGKAAQIINPAISVVEPTSQSSLYSQKFVLPSPPYSSPLSPFGKPKIDSDLPAHNLSPAAMFFAADWLVKAVIIGLLLASALSWVIFIVKSWELAAARRQAQAVLAAVLAAPELDIAEKTTDKWQKGAGAVLIHTAVAEVRLSQQAMAGTDNIIARAGLKERVESALTAHLLAAGQRANRNIGVIATIGSVSPFIGLFGTVWGIMNSFIGIAKTQTSNLAVVAPGIAEALLATAIGLFVAIPATVMFNIFVRSIGRYKAILSDIAAGLERLVSRDCDIAAARVKIKQNMEEQKHVAPIMNDKGVR